MTALNSLFLMQIVVNNIARQQEIDPIAIGFKQRVLSKMKLQIKKKLGNESKFFKLSKANQELGNG